jgi:hypothetical protein
MAEWLEDHVMAIGYFNTQHFGLVVGAWLNWRPDGALRGKWRHLVGKVGEWYVANRHLQGGSPHLCRLRTNGLTPTSKYWMYWSHVGDMGPISLVVGYQQKLDFSPLLHGLLWERSWVWTCRTVSRHAVDCVGSPSSQVQWICSNLLMTVWKVAMCGPCEIRMVVDHTQTKRGKRVACWSSFPL